MNLFMTAKALHIVGFISWFAGLFYIPRLFIYHAEARLRPEAERRVLQAQLELMAARLWKIILMPAMLVTFAAGTTMLVELGRIDPWLHWKFVLLAGLVGYHFLCGQIRKWQAAGISTWSSARLRVFNEGGTMFAVAIVFLAVGKSALSGAWAALGLLGLGVSLMIGIKLYARIRRADSAPSAVGEGASPVSKPRL